jgi:sulfite reductase (NADPH) flavoprotein alpha-component
MSVYSRQNPFAATLVDNHCLSAADSLKRVHHVVLDLAGSGIEYRVGQSIGICPRNDPQEVQRVLAAGRGFAASDSVKLPKATEPSLLQEALIGSLAINTPTAALLELLARLAPDNAVLAGYVAALPEARQEFLARYTVAELLEDFPSAAVGVGAQALVEVLRPLQPRLYSIASSPRVAGNHVALTVGLVSYEVEGRLRRGVASSYLIERLPIGARVDVFLADSPFGLTEDDRAPIIMIAAGTGIAPFRAFLQERAARRALGQSWLIFGGQYESRDFLYRKEVDEFISRGVLSHFSPAWSRDQSAKVYVQHIVAERSAEVVAWLEAGAYLYICGGKAMGRDVEQALIASLIKEGRAADIDAAEAYLKELKQVGRYKKDVY